MSYIYLLYFYIFENTLKGHSCFYTDFLIADDCVHGIVVEMSVGSVLITGGIATLRIEFALMFPFLG